MGQSQPLLCFCLHLGMRSAKLLEISNNKKYLITKRNSWADCGMVSEARKQSTVWMETDYPKHTPYSKMAATRQKLARVARKRGHKGQIGWNKNKKVNQLTLQNNCHFSLLSKLVFFATCRRCKTVRKRHLALMT